MPGIGGRRTGARGASATTVMVALPLGYAPPEGGRGVDVEVEAEDGVGRVVLPPMEVAVSMVLMVGWVYVSLTVQPVASGITVFGSVIGPSPFGIVKDLIGSFVAPFGVVAGFPMVAEVVVLVFGGRGPHPSVGRTSDRGGGGGLLLEKGYGSV